MKTLLIIDMLEDFFIEGPLREMRAELVANINALTHEARRRHIPIIWVRQEFREDLSDAFLVMRKKQLRITIAGTKGSEILSELVRSTSDFEIIKKRYSPFFNTGLEQQLKEIGSTELILSGINTHACVRAAAIDAYQRDYEVTIPIECVASYDRKHHDVTLKYFDGHIARLMQLDEVWD